MCDDHSKCVNKSKLCDLVPDCFDRSDEFVSRCDGMCFIYLTNYFESSAQSVLQLPKIDKENFSTFRPEGLRQES